MKRFFYIFVATFALMAMLSSCGQQDSRSSILKVYNWADYIDEELLGEFEEWYKEQTGEEVEVVSEECVELPERFRRTYTQSQPRASLRGVRSNTVHTMQRVSQGAEVENMEGAALFAMAEAMGFRAVEVRAISNRVGEPFEKWAVDEAVMALAKELKLLEDEK